MRQRKERLEAFNLRLGQPEQIIQAAPFLTPRMNQAMLASAIELKGPEPSSQAAVAADFVQLFQEQEVQLA